MQHNPRCRMMVVSCCCFGAAGELGAKVGANSARGSFASFPPRLNGESWCGCDLGHTPINSFPLWTNAGVNKQVYVMNSREQVRLLGGSAADWLVLVGGILLAALFAAVFVL
jgi:hypothetical protein